MNIIKNLKVFEFSDFVRNKKNSRKLYENSFLPDAESELRKQRENRARIIVNRAVVWVMVNRGFYARLLSNLNIYGSSKIDPPTMCTNGTNIVYHPDFVLEQIEAAGSLSRGEEAIRFVICHELLHCVGDHMGRRGTRDPFVWNVACDYAINPILNTEVGSGINWPIFPKGHKDEGQRMGLYEEKYEGMSAEEIYDILMEEGGASAIRMKIPKSLIDIYDSEDDMPSPDSEDSIVQEIFSDIEGEEDDEDCERGSCSSGGDKKEEKDGEKEGGDGDERGDERGDEEGEDEGGDGDEGGDEEGDKKAKGKEGEGDKDGDEISKDGEGSTNLIGRKIQITSGPNKGKTGIIKKVLSNGNIIIE